MEIIITTIIIITIIIMVIIIIIINIILIIIIIRVTRLVTFSTRHNGITSLHKSLDLIGPESPATFSWGKFFFNHEI